MTIGLQAHCILLLQQALTAGLFHCSSSRIGNRIILCGSRRGCLRRVEGTIGSGTSKLHPLSFVHASSRGSCRNCNPLLRNNRPSWKNNLSVGMSACMYVAQATTLMLSDGIIPPTTTDSRWDVWTKRAAWRDGLRFQWGLRSRQIRKSQRNWRAWGNDGLLSRGATEIPPGDSF